MEHIHVTHHLDENLRNFLDEILHEVKKHRLDDKAIAKAAEQLGIGTDKLQEAINSVTKPDSSSR